jgi:hypothetical protein
MATKADHPIIHQIIQELQTSRPVVLNSDIAEEASRRLGKKITTSDVSRIKTTLGINMYQEAERERTAALSELMAELLKHHAIAKAEVLELPPDLRPLDKTHQARQPLSRRYRNLLLGAESPIVALIDRAELNHIRTVAFKLRDLPVEPELLYAVLWYASSRGIEVCVKPSI